MIKFLIPIIFLLTNCKGNFKEESLKNTEMGSVACKENPVTVNNELFCMSKFDSLQNYYHLSKLIEGKWEKQVDSVYVTRYFEFENDRNSDGFKDLTVDYSRWFIAFLYNPDKKIFENEGVDLSNNFELLDTTSQIYCNNPVTPFDQIACNLFTIVDYKQQYKYVLATSPDVLKNGKYEHVLYKVINNQLGSLKEVKIFYDEYDYMSFDYTQYWKSFIRTSLYKNP